METLRIIMPGTAVALIAYYVGGLYVVTLAVRIKYKHPAIAVNANSLDCVQMNQCHTLLSFSFKLQVYPQQALVHVVFNHVSQCRRNLSDTIAVARTVQYRTDNVWPLVGIVHSQSGLRRTMPQPQVAHRAPPSIASTWRLSAACNNPS